MLIHMTVGRPQFLFGLLYIGLVTIWQVCSSRLSDLRERERASIPEWANLRGDVSLLLLCAVGHPPMLVHCGAA